MTAPAPKESAMSLNWVHAATAVGGLLLGLAITGAIGLSGNALGTRAGADAPPTPSFTAPSRDIQQAEAPIVFDLSTDNYVGDKNYQVKIEDIDVLNSSVTSLGKMSNPIGTEEAVLVVERVYKGIDDLYGWRLEVENGTLDRRDIEITVMDASFDKLKVVTLTDAWPQAWEMPDMENGSSGATTETMIFLGKTLTVEDAE